MKTKTKVAIASIALLGLAAGGVAAQVKQRWAEDTPPVKTEKAVLVAPPNVPPPIDRNKPVRVIVELETTEQKGTLATGVEYTFWTFGARCPDQ